MAIGRKRAARLVCMLMALLLFPGWVELAENVEHLFHDGHLAHSIEHDDSQAADHPLGSHQEAPCSPGDHHCECCVSSPSVAPLAIAWAPVVWNAVGGSTAPAYHGHPLTRPTAPPLPPPKA